MANTPQTLLHRLDEIGASLAQTGHALALIGLGSVGTERERLDAFSDLDFFAIVQPGCKGDFILDLSWLSRIVPLAYHFQNTRDGYKALFEDGIFCEFAVFEPAELAHIPFSPGRIVWKADGVNDDIRLPAPREQRPPKAPSPEWLLGEALTNLYVGLGRFHRGERLSAQRFIQHYAVDRVLELAPILEPAAQAANAAADTFTLERRFEARHPHIGTHLAQFVQGYERSRESAAAILAFLEQHFDVNPAMSRAIRELC